MYYEVKIKKNIYNCYYETRGNKKHTPLIILHGWGLDSSSYSNIVDELHYYVILVDFLGFGKSDKPITPLQLGDYVSQINQLVIKLKLNNYILMGHSFGGRVAIKYNYYFETNKIILVDSAGIKNRSLKLKFKILKYKFKKKLYFIISKKKYNKLITCSGSKDYKTLSPIMKQTMSKVIKEDLKKYCKTKNNKVVILWGINDEETPLRYGYTFYNLYKNARLIVFYKSDHFPYLREREKFIRVINSVNND